MQSGLAFHHRTHRRGPCPQISIYKSIYPFVVLTSASGLFSFPVSDETPPPGARCTEFAQLSREFEVIVGHIDLKISNFKFLRFYLYQECPV